ncbi:uncharacterized protein isoform X2 [Leptinotarsa decemlineata]|uniref:uncharacterized protein isoform X2 n=1 Tax=Leptinotarsa decemlineata TaxID=7539 RepID=UPI003D30B023
MKMFLKFIVIVEISLLVKCVRFDLSANNKYYEIPTYNIYGSEDIYNGNRQDVYKGHYGSSRIPPSVEQIASSSFEESSHHDRIDFHYPHVEFLTKDETTPDFGEFQSSSVNQFHFTPSPQIIEDDAFYKKSTRRPRLKVHNVNSSEYSYEPVKLSHIQKVFKPTVENENTKYEEIYTEALNTPEKNSTKERINVLLKKYLSKLYSQKFNNSYKNEWEATVIPQSVSENEKELSPKTKYYDSSLWSLKNEKIQKINKLFSLFTIVQFNNSQCNATSSAGSYLGICYTTYECSNLGGTAVGNCASGYGVCCVFRGTCGGFVSQNCSYFESPNYPDYYPPGGGVIIPTTLPPPTSSQSPTPDPRFPLNSYKMESRQSDSSLLCTFSVYKINGKVSKMKIDFLDLELTGPTNGTCINERLVISGQNMNDIIPTICGYNTGQSIYVDVSTMSGPLQLMVLSNVSYRKRFRFRICQYADSCLEPTSNCLQYYTGVTGTISSFNYDQVSMFNRSVPVYFNNLNYAICIRREAGFCSITYTNVRNGVEYPFELRNVDGVSTLPRGIAGVDTIDCPDDYIVVAGTRLCGYKFNDGSNSNFTVNAPVTDTNAGPIVIPVRTNSAVTGLGFKLFYTQNRCIT